MQIKEKSIFVGMAHPMIFLFSRVRNYFNYTYTLEGSNFASWSVLKQNCWYTEKKIRRMINVLRVYQFATYKIPFSTVYQNVLNSFIYHQT